MNKINIFCTYVTDFKVYTLIKKTYYIYYFYFFYYFFKYHHLKNKGKASQRGTVKSPSNHTFVFNFKRNIHAYNKSTHIVEGQNIFIHFLL